MGSIIEINDTLQISREQGFPTELDYETHKRNPYLLEQFIDRTFEFKDKPAIRVYQVPPVRNFLVENRAGKWIYWGLIHITEIVHAMKAERHRVNSRLSTSTPLKRF